MLGWIKYLKDGFTRGSSKDKFKTDGEYSTVRHNLRHIYPSVLKSWKIGVATGIVILVSSFIAFPVPLISRYMIDNVILKKRLELFLPVLILLAVVKGAQLVLTHGRTYLNTRFDQAVIYDLNEKLITKVLSLPKTFFDKAHIGYLQSRLTSDINSIKWFFSSTLVQIVINIIRFFGGIGFLLYLEWRIAVPVILSLPFPVIAAKFFAKRSYIMTHYNSEIGANFSSVFHETLASMPLIKSFSKEKSTTNKLLSQIKHRFRISNEQMVIGTVNSTIMNFMPSIARTFVFIFGAYWVIKGDWTLGTLYAFQGYLSYVYGPIGFLTGSLNSFQQAKASLERVSTLFEMLPEENTDTGIDVDKIDGSVTFENVSFAYEKDKPVLKNISFRAEPGEHWAVIGQSGVGKTTLVSLILRFYKPQSGAVIFDDRKASEYNVRSLRKRIGYVSQRSILTSGTILDNIMYGKPKATRDEVIHAAKVAEIHDTIDALEKKYATVLDEQGCNLSEGQKQRISIARAIIKNPDILVMDEPTSALDNLTEKSIYQHLPECIRGRTTFTIAHRLSTIKNADKVILLLPDHKYIIGTHEELVKISREYNEFFDNIND